MKTRMLLIVCAFGALTSSIWAQDYRLEPFAAFGFHGDGSVRPGDYSFLTADGQRYQRGMAYNPTTGHLLVVSRDPANIGIYILDGTYGDMLGSLDFSSYLPGGNVSFVINLIAVADDGAIYVGNLSSANSPPEFRLYRWEDETAPQTLVYPNPPDNSGDPGNGNTDTANRRWGDTMTVRGSGTNTEILLASRGTLISVLKPVNGDMSTFTSTPMQTAVPSGALGYGLTFGPGNTFYGTAGAQSGGPLYVLERLPGATNATTTRTFAASVLANNLTPIAYGHAFGRDFLAGISMAPGADVVRLYDITSGPTNIPVFLDRESFVTTNNNGVFAGAIAFGDDHVYALDSDNGVMAFTIVGTNSPVIPAVIVQPVSRNVLIGSNVTFTVAADGTPPFAYQWLFNGNAIAGASSSSLVVSNAQSTNAGSYSVIVSNAAATTLSSTVVLAVASQPVSTLLVYEPFDYAEGTALTNHGGWLLNSGTSATIETNSLSMPGLVVSSGNRVSWGQASMSVRLPLGTNIASGSAYYSFVMNVESLGASFTGNGVLAGFTTGTGTSFGTKVDIRNNGDATFTLGTSKAGSGTQVFDTNSFPVGTNILVVGRYTFNAASGDDVASLWINPDPATFGADAAPAPNLTTTGGTDLTQIDRFFFRAGSASTTPDKLIVDELRVGGTWADVTPSSVIAPRLIVTRNGQSVVLQWMASPGAFILESTSAFPASWQAETEPVIHDKGTNTVAISMEEPQQFFRLRQ